MDTINVTITHEDRMYVAECKEIPAVTQASTLDELMRNIREVVEITLESEDLRLFGFTSFPKIAVRYELETEYA